MLYLTGNAFEPLAYLIFLLFCVVQGAKGRHHMLILTTLVIFIMGDSRLPDLQWPKNLRLIITIYLFFLTLAQMFRRQYRFRPLYLIVLVFLFFSLVVAPLNPSPALSVSKAISYVFMLFIAMHYFHHQIRQQGPQLLEDVVRLSFWVALIGVAFIFFRPGMVFFEESGRFRGVFGNPNGLGVYVTLLIPMAYLLFSGVNKQLSRRFRLLAWGILLFSLFLTFSRNGLISTFFFFLLAWLHREGFRLKTFVFYLFLIPAIAIMSNPIIIVEVIKLTGFEEQLRVETILSGSGRFFAWQWAMEVFGENPILGRGFAFEEILFHDFMPKWLYATGHQGGVHNSYIAFLLNNGVVGLTLILMFFMGLLRRIPVKRFIPAIIFSCGFSAFFEPWLNSSLNAFTVHFLLLILFYTHLSPRLIKSAPPA